MSLGVERFQEAYPVYYELLARTLFPGAHSVSSFYYLQNADPTAASQKPAKGHGHGNDVQKAVGGAAEGAKRDELKQLRLTLSLLEAVQLTSEQICDVLRALAGVLYLGSLPLNVSLSFSSLSPSMSHRVESYTSRNMYPYCALCASR